MWEGRRRRSRKAGSGGNLPILATVTRVPWKMKVDIKTLGPVFTEHFLCAKCFGYLSLHNKLSQNFLVLNSHFILSYTFVGQEFGAGLGWTSLPFCFMWHQLRLLNGLCWRLGVSGGSKMAFLMCLVPWWEWYEVGLGWDHRLDCTTDACPL